MIIEVGKSKYKLIENYREAFDKDLFLEKYTSYFETYDFIVGDIAYSKLRLKGFNKKENKNFNTFNDCNNIKKYVKENCAYECRYFILEKTK